MKKMNAIKPTELKRMNQEYLADDKQRIVRNALTENDIAKISRVFEATAANPNLFSIDIPVMPATNQMRSGRCWLFSSMNLLREMLAKKYKIKGQFELSQNYIAFYDKLEKINYYLETSIQEIDTPIQNETLRFVMQNAIGDGGQWDMMVSLVKKYGICPKTAMPETFQSSHTHSMTQILNRRLRKFTMESRKAHAEGNDADVAILKETCLKECYALLCDCFGVPPQSFTFEYVDQKGKYHATNNITPLEFYENYLGVDLDDYVGIINGPTQDKPFHQMYTVKYLGNVCGTKNPVSFLNLPMKEFKEAILKQLKANELVWFGCDCSKDGDRIGGLWDDALFDYENTFGMSLAMSKADMLDSREAAMNHAMVLTGVNLENGKPTRWKIENSWGKDAGNGGFFICSDSWFDQYMFEAVVHKKYLTAAQRKCLSKKPIVLDPWDPFGSLAD